MSTTTRTGDYDHCAYVHEKVGIRCGGYRKGHEERYVDHPFTEAATLPPEQPALEGDGEWHTERVSNLETVIRNQHGTKIGLFVEQKHAEQAVTDHARAALVRWMIVEFQLLRDTAFAFHVDEKHKPEAFATCQHHVCLRACEVWNNVTAAARKAGVE